MLLFRSHYRFATERNPERERRLCCFADDRTRKVNPNDPNAQSTNAEESDAANAEIPEGAAERANIETAADKFRSRIEKLNPIVAKATANSPVAIREIATLLENPDIVKDLKNLQQRPEEISQQLDAYYAALIAGTQTAGQQETLTAMLQDMAESPRVALHIAEMFDGRLGTYDEQARFLKNVSLNACAQAAEQMDPEQIGRLMEKQGALDANDVGWIDQTLRGIGIDPASITLSQDERKTVEERTGKKLDANDYDANGVATPRRRLLILRDTLDRSRLVLSMEKNDGGKQTTLESLGTIRAALEKQNGHAREHLKRILAARAEELRASNREFYKYLAETYGNDEAKAEHDLGIGTQALKARVTEIETSVAQAIEPGGLPDVAAAEFVAKAGEAMAKLDDLAPLKDPDMKVRLNFLVGEGRQDREDTEMWAARNATRIAKAIATLKTDPTVERRLNGMNATSEKLQVYADVAKRAAEGKTTAKDWNFLRDFCDRPARERMNMLLLTIEHPWLIEKAREDRKIIEHDDTKNAPETRSALQQELQTVTETIFEGGLNGAPKIEAFKHTTAQVTRVEKHFRMKLQEIGRNIEVAGLVRPPKEFAYGEQMLRRAHRELAKVREATKLLREFYAENTTRVVVLKRPQYQRMNEADTIACYRQDLGVIYLNEDALRELASQRKTSFEQVRDEAILHERGHAIVDVLLRRVALFPGILADLYGTLERPIPNDPENRTFEQVLYTRAADWQLSSTLARFRKEEIQILQGAHDASAVLTAEQQATVENRAQTRYREVLFDEFLNKYSSWENQGSTEHPNPDFSAEDIALFTAFDPLGLGPKMNTEAINERIRQGVTVHSTQAPTAMPQIAPHGADGGDGHGAEQQEQGPSKEESAVSDKMKKAQSDLLVIKSFIEAHQSTRGIDVFTKWVNDWERAFEDKIKNPFYNPPHDNPFSEDYFVHNLEKMNLHFISPATDQMDDVIKAEMDMHDVESSGHHGWFHSLQMISLNDIYQMGVKVGEDLQRMWTHRGDNVQASLGESLTKWIPTNEIWGLKYLGQLKHEFHRRTQETELHEVGIWKEALKNLDAHELQHMLGEAKEKEQLRGIIELLIEKGRLDLNDMHFWHTLMELSGMHGMPTLQCKSSDVLRDKWLQKMVTAIWDDKDKFFEWRQSNDGAFESGKKKFTNTTDQLSNVKGGLGDTLSKQLKLWVDAREHHTTVPDEVNPHLYEEILHYAMRNGKMSMEDKLYYLVQGVATELLSIDRLRIMAGQTGEILNLFPFIDYFYMHNNSLPEVQALAERLREPDKPYKPGPKTTLWLHMELLRDSRAQERMSKAMSGARTEKLDHEDFPALVSQMSFAEVNEITGVLSGSRYKMSYEAAKNTYTGFGTKFKVLANLAELAQDGKATFTEQDASEAAKSIAAYIQMDNILTNNARTENRISLSFDQLKQKAVSSGTGLVVSDYRNANQTFVKELVDVLPINWGKIGVGFEQNKDLGKFNKDEFVRSTGDESIVTDVQRQKRNMNAMPDFVRELKNAIMRNPAVLKEILIRHREDFYEENFAEKGKPDAYLSKKVMQSYLDDRKHLESKGHSYRMAH